MDANVVHDFSLSNVKTQADFVVGLHGDISAKKFGSAAKSLRLHDQDLVSFAARSELSFVQQRIEDLQHCRVLQLD
jgi:hypothetical protein